jgi:hypothetical protein
MWGMTAKSTKEKVSVADVSFAVRRVRGLKIASRNIGLLARHCCD